MPRGDRTGPEGRGANTGRAAGFCAGFDMPGYANPAQIHGVGMGFGRGCPTHTRGFGGSRGGRNKFYATGGHPGQARFGGYSADSTHNLDPKREKQLLKRQAEDLQAEIDSVHKRLAEFERKADSE